MQLRGAGASPGRAAGPLFLVGEPPAPPPPGGGGMPEARDAMRRAGDQLSQLAAQVRARNPEGAGVLEAQAMLAQDPALEPAIEEGLEDGLTPAAAIGEAFEKQAVELERLGAGTQVGTRGADVREAGRAVVAAFAGRTPGRLAGLRSPSVVVARQLEPADTLAVEPRLLLGIVTERGGTTSHAAIVARELGVPAVVGAAGAIAAARGATWGELDGATGAVDFSAHADAAGATGGATEPGRKVAGPARAWLPLFGNAGSVAAVRAAAALGAQGIGLLRTEFFYLGRPEPPDEEEQVRVLESACAAMGSHPVVVRTLDAGSDKSLPYLPQEDEPNPALGTRGVRLWLAHEELAAIQIRALLRTHAEHPLLRVLIPMVATRTEMEAVRERFRVEARSLSLPLPAIGIMVETPAAAVSLPTFAGVADFVSLGTNDLSQYATGADRGRPRSEELGEWNPGTLRLLATALAAARELGIDAGVCGEMAGEEDGAVLLAGLGANSLSMAAGALAGVAATLRHVAPESCAVAAREALAARSAAAAREAVRRYLA